MVPPCCKDGTNAAVTPSSLKRLFMEIGIISDTHGTVSQSALDALTGVDRILHAGDIGSADVLEVLRHLAPTDAIRGNTDGEAWCENLPLTEILDVDHTTFYLLHDLQTLDLDPKSAGIQVVIHGHTHCSALKTRDGVLYFNPGSASYARHGGPLSVGRIEISDGRIVPRIIGLDG
jgi:putative phosphoesterase